jgi:hypothetical protein
LCNYDGQLHILHKPDQYTNLFYLTDPPYDFFEEVALYDGEVVAKNLYRLNPEMVAAYMFADAKAGALERYVFSIQEKPSYAKVEDNYKVTWVPATQPR